MKFPCNACTYKGPTKAALTKHSQRKRSSGCTKHQAAPRGRPPVYAGTLEERLKAAKKTWLLKRGRANARRRHDNLAHKMGLTQTYGYKTAPDKKKKKTIRYGNGIVVSGGTDKPRNLGKKRTTVVDAICRNTDNILKSPPKKSPPCTVVVTPSKEMTPMDTPKELSPDYWGVGVTSALAV